jgi:glycerophosphoryl diester phosphodiesterase
MKPLFIAHRGASYEAPENTLAAVNLAWQLDADGVEIDIQLTKDNQVVVFHDDNTLRYQGDTRLISEYNYPELLVLDVGKFKGDKYIGEKIPLLSDVINTVPKNRKLVIEIKSGAEIVSYLRSAVEQSKINHDQIVFISFRRDSITQIKKAIPECKALRLYELKQIPFLNTTFPSIRRLIREVTHDKLDGVDISFVPAINKSFIKQIQDCGLIMYFWTINNPEQAQFLVDSGADGITTDRPKWLTEQIDLNLIEHKQSRT